MFLPDTQFYSAFYPDTFVAQTQWIADHQAEFNIQAVIHEGDVVNVFNVGSVDHALMWSRADAAFAILDAAEIPYIAAIGNHDFDTSGSATRAATEFNGTLSQARYMAHSWWDGGFYEADHTENSYLLLTMGGVDYILLNLEFGARDEILTWANGILTTYADRRCIIVTHSFVFTDGTRVGSGDAHNPKVYPLGATANDGEDMWTKLVKLHDNIIWVQGGHHVQGHAARRSDLSDGGQVVHQVFANWQDVGGGVEGVDNGDGWLRIVTFGAGQARVQTYSPTLFATKTDAANKFMVSL